MSLRLEKETPSHHPFFREGPRETMVGSIFQKLCMKAPKYFSKNKSFTPSTPNVKILYRLSGSNYLNRGRWLWILYVPFHTGLLKKFQVCGPKGLSKYIYFSRQLGNGTTFRKSIKYSILYFNCFPIFISLCYNYILLVNRDSRLKY